jgi:predicted transcriptional regulator
VTRENALFDTTDRAADADADARAEADLRAGRIVSHDAVKSWLRSWGTDRVLPRPKVGE